MIESILIIFFLTWFSGSIIFLLIFSTIAEQNNNTTLQALKDLTIELFCDKNWFGILLSLLVCIVLVPSYVFSVITEIMCVCYNVLLYIWKLGEKRRYL